MGLGIPEIAIIIIAIAVLLFGGKKITELSRSMGRASGEFKKAKREVERELKEEETAATDSTVTPEVTPVASSEVSTGTGGDTELKQ